MTTSNITVPSAGEPPLRYVAAFKFLWNSPRVWMNLLMTSVCVLIPAVGFMVLIGYACETFMRDPSLLENDLPYPDFDFNRFVDYLKLGLWPFLVSLAVGLAIGLVAGLFIAIPMIVLTVMNAPAALVMLFFVFAIAAMMAMSVAAQVITAPMMLRAVMLGNFKEAFNLRWIRDFFARTWKELILTSLFALVASIPLAIVGYALCFVGVYAAMAVIVIAQWHLHFQAYRIYLARGGTPVERDIQPGFAPIMPPASQL